MQDTCTATVSPNTERFELVHIDLQVQLERITPDVGRKHGHNADYKMGLLTKKGNTLYSLHSKQPFFPIAMPKVRGGA